jgi:hypothetical protein
MKYDFSGYATKVDLKCTDGRVIRKDTFKHDDGRKVPLVWQHLHNDPSNILGQQSLRIGRMVCMHMVYSTITRQGRKPSP